MFYVYKFMLNRGCLFVKHFNLWIPMLSVDMLSAGQLSAFWRYRTTTKADAYGKAVYKHLTLIKNRLQNPDSEGKPRQGWLRLLKDIADWVACVRKRKADAPKK